ncbi:MAG: NAD(P)/FAD-dependent oxidoreductase, partial [Parabacteroides sp.]|nr:NAD(P)/FAD-dependent oxidoreductase [Parabacteroides sp.]
MKYDVAIIGGGPAGYTAAERAAAGGLSTLLFEKNALGGVCLNEGCVPTKTLLYSAKTYDNIKHAAKYAIKAENPSFDLGKIIARKNKVVKKLTAGIRMKMTEQGVNLIAGAAEIKGRAEDGTITIACGEESYEAANLLICTGSETVIPPIPGLAETDYWTSREALLSKELPASLVIIGGGVIGMEFASFFNSLGTEVHVVEMLDKILGPMDRELSAQLQAEYAKRGVKFYLGHKVTGVHGTEVSVEKEGESFTLHGDKVLLSVGRRPVTKGFGLETLGLEPFRNGIWVNDRMQTSVPNVYACGDITAFSLLAHTAVSEAEVAVSNLLGHEAHMSYKAIPGVVYTNPEIAGVGKTEEELQAAGITYQVKKIPMAFSGRFVAENEMGNGACKLILSEDGT